MSSWRFESGPKQRGSVVLSIAVHVIVIALIASITFRYPISALLGPSREQLTSERIQYVRVQPAAPRSGTTASGCFILTRSTQVTQPSLRARTTTTAQRTSCRRTNTRRRMPAACAVQ